MVWCNAGNMLEYGVTNESHHGTPKVISLKISNKNVDLAKRYFEL